MLIQAVASAHPRRQRQPSLQLGEVFRRFGPAYRHQQRVTAAEAKVMHAIEVCRTPILGGHRRVCMDCGHQVETFNSCRNRHCPTCQALPQAKWIARQEQRILPVRHFHVVLTLPAQLRSVAYANRQDVFALLLRSAAETLLELGKDPKRLGAQLGITAVLHTWTRDLQFHPHVHCIVTAGGLALKGSPRWLHVAGDFLFPVAVISKLFQGKFLAGLRERYKANKLTVPVRTKDIAAEAAFDQLMDELYKLQWITYCREPLAGPAHLYRYLGRYTHRVAISNQRLIRVDEHGIRFATKDGNAITLKPKEFIRRFLMHILPGRFVKIRHYGLQASSNVHTRLDLARRLLTPVATDTAIEKQKPNLRDLPWEELFLHLTNIDLRVCSACGGNNLRRFCIAPRPPVPLDTS